MILKTINFSTGPVEIEENVNNALSAPPISHRSQEFVELYHNIVDTLCEQVKVEQTYILQGTGTLANDVMIWQIKSLSGRGIVLSNGEFGDRLIDQCSRNSLKYSEYKINWGEEFNLQELESLIYSTHADWIFFCHCETSTGIINDLDGIVLLSNNHGLKCYVDCVSTIGNRPLDLSNITMATASSGKGLGSIPGLALVFSNDEIKLNQSIPKYFDLSFYSKKNGVPFTVSSNLLQALIVSINHRLHESHWAQCAHYSQKISESLKSCEVIPFANGDSRVFTIVPNDLKSEIIGERLYKNHIYLSYQSDYLLKRNWLQLALFGTYNDEQINYAIEKLIFEFCPSAH